MKMALWILHCYPRRWRERYQEEMLALLEQHCITPKTVIDLFLGALDARLNSIYRSKGGFVLQQIRDNRSLSFIYLCALAVFLLTDSFCFLLVPPNALFSEIIVDHVGFDFIEAFISVMSLIALFGVISATIGKACKKGQWGIITFALVCLGVTFWVVWLSPSLLFHNFFNLSDLFHMNTLIDPLINFLPVFLFGGGLFLTGVNGLKLLREHRRQLLLFALLLGLLPPVSYLMCIELVSWVASSLSGLSAVSAVLGFCYLSGPFLTLSGLLLGLATGTVTQRSWQTARIWGLLLAFLLLARLITIVVWDVSIWIFNPLIIIELILALALAFMFLALLRSFLIPAEEHIPIPESERAGISRIPS